MSVHCLACGKVNQDGAVYCSSCGQRIRLESGKIPWGFLWGILLLTAVAAALLYLNQAGALRLPTFTKQVANPYAGFPVKAPGFEGVTVETDGRVTVARRNTEQETERGILKAVFLDAWNEPVKSDREEFVIPAGASRSFTFGPIPTGAARAKIEVERFY